VTKGVPARDEVVVELERRRRCVVGGCEVRRSLRELGLAAES
jgi:hypothetical protein